MSVDSNSERRLGPAEWWFSVRVHRVPERIWHRMGRWLLAVVELVVDPAALVPTSTAPYRVAVVRRDNGVEVATFDYAGGEGAGVHQQSLQQRLATMNLWDFARDAGIAFPLIADARPIQGRDPS
jgi:hypothetical protein